MNCPNCGVDVEKWPEEQKKAQERQKEEACRKEEFQKTCAASLRSLKRRRMFWGFLIGALFMLSIQIGAFSILIFTSPSFTIKDLTNVSSGEVWKPILFLLVAVLGFGVLGSFSASEGSSKKEKQLWDDFCPTHPIE